MVYLIVGSMKEIKDLKNLINPHKQTDKQFFLQLLDGAAQEEYERQHVEAVMQMLKVLYLNKIRVKIKAAREEKEKLKGGDGYTAEKYRRVLELNAEIEKLMQGSAVYKPFFSEPYFARMDVVDDKEGYNSYYIGKHGDEGLEIVDWRAPLARKYYQKSRTSFKINDYDYKLILRRALRTQSGKLVDMKNEYLNLSDYLTKEEIGGNDEALIFDPFLKDILKSRKEKQEICDIIETIQERQFEIITLPERDEFIVQGVAGSGKTMILLHRLSYIMYNNESVRPSDVIVITPSDSFNAFIDELSAVLELEKVRTSTLDSYFINLLKSAGVDVSARVDFNAPVPVEFLKYIYSPQFYADLDKKLGKVFDGIYGLFASDDCKEAAGSVLSACENQSLQYDKIKNSSLRIRRCVLGEIKEKPDGGLYYTKPFRGLFNCVQSVREFFELVGGDNRMKEYAFFYKQLLSFYKSLRFISRYGSKICEQAQTDLNQLKAAVEKEANDLKRYRQKIGDTEVLTYADRIEKREELVKEIEGIICCVERINSDFVFASDFCAVMRGDTNLVAIGKCETNADILRFFYRETIKKTKQRYGIATKPLIKSDPFALCAVMVKLGFNLSPKFAFMFIDEAQDISASEYEILRKVNDRAIFNIFGDLKQNITAYRGIESWEALSYPVYELNLNYRNTNQIVNYVAEKLSIAMNSIGFDGTKVERLSRRSVTGWLTEKAGLKAVICTERSLPEYSRKSYNILRETGKISKNKINIMTVYESKGLEFTAVAVADGDMTDNEKYIAYTRALKELAVIE